MNLGLDALEDFLVPSDCLVVEDCDDTNELLDVPLAENDDKPVHR